MAMFRHLQNIHVYQFYSFAASVIVVFLVIVVLLIINSHDSKRFFLKREELPDARVVFWIASK